MNEVNKVSDQEFKARLDSLDINEINYLAAKKKKRDDKIEVLKDLYIKLSRPILPYVENVEIDNDSMKILQEIIDDYVLPN